MTQEAQDFFTKFKRDAGKMRKQTGDMINGFETLYSKVMHEGALTVLEKECIAVGISVAMQCEPCIKLHTKSCLKAGATKEQVLEAACVAVVMGGGPAYTHIPMVIDTLETLLSE
jgi:AhpD family alkylhydroperoxidase